MKSARLSLSMALVMSLYLTPIAATQGVLPPFDARGGAITVPLDHPYPIDVHTDGCRETITRTLKAWNALPGQVRPIALPQPLHTLYRAGIEDDPADVSWSDWIQGAIVALHWEMSTVGHSGACDVKMTCGLRGRDELEVVIAPEADRHGTVIVENRISQTTAIIEAENHDWPEKDEKLFEARVHLSMTDVNGGIWTSTENARVSVPESISATGSFTVGVRLTDDGRPAPHLSYTGSAQHGTSSGAGFILGPVAVAGSPVVEKRVTYGPGGLRQTFAISSSAESQLRIKEREHWYSGTTLSQHLSLLNTWERIQILCHRGDAPVIGPPPETPEDPSVGEEFIPPPEIPRSPSPASEQVARLTLDLPDTITVGRPELAIVRLVGTNEGGSVNVVSTDENLVAIAEEAVEVTPGSGASFMIEGVAPGTTALRLWTDTLSVEHIVTVLPAPPGSLLTSFLQRTVEVGELFPLVIELPEPVDSCTAVTVTSSSPSVCEVEGQPEAEGHLPENTRRLEFLLRALDSGGADVHIVIPTMGVYASVRVDVQEPSHGIDVQIEDGTIANAPMTLPLRLRRAAPDGLMLTWSISGSRSSDGTPAGKLEGVHFGSRYYGEALDEGEMLLLELDPGCPSADGSGGLEIHLRWSGSFEGDARRHVHHSSASRGRILDSLVELLGRVEGGPAGSLGTRARRARTHLARDRTTAATESLRRILRALPTSGLLVGDREGVQSRIEQVLRDLPTPQEAESDPENGDFR